MSLELPNSSFLFRTGPLGLLGWQWLALPVVALLAIALGSLLSRITRAALSRATRHTSTPYDDAILARLGRPLTLGWAIASAFIIIVPLELEPRAEDLIHRWLKALALVVFFWAPAPSPGPGAIWRGPAVEMAAIHPSSACAIRA